MNSSIQQPPEIRDPETWLESRRRAAWDLYHQSQNTAALGVCLEAMAHTPRASWAYYLMGMIYLRSAMRPQAAAMMRAFIAFEPDQGAAYTRKAQALLEDIRDYVREQVDLRSAPLQQIKFGGKIPLAINMIVKNEAPRLPRLLRSLEGLNPAQLIAVDTGSTDETPELLRAAGFTVIHDPWRDDFAYSRNVALEATDAEWAMWLDADDELAPDAPVMIRSLIASQPKADFHVFRLAYGGTLSAQMRMWRKAVGIRWMYAIHERIFPPQGAVVDHHPEITVRHYDDERRPDKIQRNIDMLEKRVKLEPANAYFRFYHAIGLGVAGRDAEALEQAQAYMSLTSDIPDHISSRNYIRYFLGWRSLHFEPRDLQKSVEYCLQGIASTPCTAEFWCLLGDIYLGLERPVDAYTFYQTALHVGEWNWTKFWLTDPTKYDQYPRMMMEKIEQHIGPGLKQYLFQLRWKDNPFFAVQPN